MSLESFYAKFNSLIKSVKRKKNPQLKVFLCSASPLGDTDVIDINTVIIEKINEHVTVVENFENVCPHYISHNNHLI